MSILESSRESVKFIRDLFVEALKRGIIFRKAVHNGTYIFNPLRSRNPPLISLSEYLILSESS
jgi:hypothetical protein